MPPTVVEAGLQDSPHRVLWIRLKSAHNSLVLNRRLVQVGAAESTLAESSQSAVDILAAQLEARRDDLRDQTELLQAQLVTREADVATADAQLRQASDRLDIVAEQVRRLVVSKAEQRQTEQDVVIRKAEREKKQAEAREISVRLAQLTRQLKQAEELVKSSGELLAKSAAQAGRGPVAPSSAPER